MRIKSYGCFGRAPARLERARFDNLPRTSTHLHNLKHRTPLLCLTPRIYPRRHHRKLFLAPRHQRHRLRPRHRFLRRHLVDIFV